MEQEGLTWGRQRYHFGYSLAIALAGQVGRPVVHQLPSAHGPVRAPAPAHERLGRVSGPAQGWGRDRAGDSPQRGLPHPNHAGDPEHQFKVIIYPLHGRGERGAMGPQVGAQKLGLPGGDSAEGMGTLSI